MEVECQLAARVVLPHLLGVTVILPAKEGTTWNRERESRTGRLSDESTVEAVVVSLPVIEAADGRFHD
jgi:hypothetical protein